MGWTVEFVYGKAVGGPFVTGVLEQWHWRRIGGSYAKHHGFFDVHWEAQEANPLEIRLHVESPCDAVDAELNSLKSALVASLLDENLRLAIEGRGFEYRRGLRVSDKCIRGFKSTEPFRVILDSARAGDIEANLSLVHREIGDLVEARIAPLLPAIRRKFA